MKKIRLLAIIALFSAFLPLNKAEAKVSELVIAFTAETHAMLYHCNCPVEPDGGITRRATLIKQLKSESADALVLDSGNFSAGGLLDQYTLNDQIDKQRTAISIKAMELMKYDAIAVGDDEFNFGKDFLEGNIGKSSLKFLSANLAPKGSLPYIIKESAGLKVGIIGLTNAAAKNKSGELKFADPKAVLPEVIASLKKKGAQVIVLLSNLGESEDLILLEKNPDIDVIIDGHAQQKGVGSFVKVGKAFILRPSWQGRRLNKAVFTIKNNKLDDVRFFDVRLSDKVIDDPDVQAVLPRCFSDGDCRKLGLVGSCQNPAGLDSSCLFKEAKKIPFTVITSKECLTCSPEQVVSYFKNHFPGLEVSYLYYPDKKAASLVSDLKISALPAYLLGKEAQDEDSFKGLRPSLEDKGAFYLLKPEAAGLTYFLNRKRINGKLDLFISLYNQETAGLLAMIKEFNPALHFLAVFENGSFTSPAGQLEVEDNLRAVCVQKYYPESFWQYITCRANNIKSSWWEDCLKVKDREKVSACAKGSEGKALLRNNCSLNKELQIMYGPTYLLDNQEIFSSKGSISKDEFKKIIRR